ncbi:LLM class flavin-dependent oxidoreductase [Streptomyces sp. NPDC046316]|uniref:LLM class flavin-dependent oxidoreductase n=1 Tax=Streptomyces sp. NPDC046316 TaxID=3154494 RepID=UPI0033E49841
MTQSPNLLGHMTAPAQVDCHDTLEAWRDVDTIPEIEHAWPFDHLMPISGGPTRGPTKAGHCSQPSSHHQRLRLGLLVTSNRIRPPTMLAKIAATVDVISGGRLHFGIGVGSRPSDPVTPLSVAFR